MAPSRLDVALGPLEDRKLCMRVGQEPVLSGPAEILGGLRRYRKTLLHSAGMQAARAQDCNRVHGELFVVDSFRKLEGVLSSIVAPLTGRQHGARTPQHRSRAGILVLIEGGDRG